MDLYIQPHTFDIIYLSHIQASYRFIRSLHFVIIVGITVLFKSCESLWCLWHNTFHQDISSLLIGNGVQNLVDDVSISRGPGVVHGNWGGAGCDGCHNEDRVDTAEVAKVACEDKGSKGGGVGGKRGWGDVGCERDSNEDVQERDESYRFSSSSSLNNSTLILPIGRLSCSLNRQWGGCLRCCRRGSKQWCWMRRKSWTGHRQSGR